MNKGLKNKGLGSWFCLAAALVALITGIVFLLTQATAAPLGHSGTMAGVVLLVGAAASLVFFFVSVPFSALIQAVIYNIALYLVVVQLYFVFADVINHVTFAGGNAGLCVFYMVGTFVACLLSVIACFCKQTKTGEAKATGKQFAAAGAVVVVAAVCVGGFSLQSSSLPSADNAEVAPDAAQTSAEGPVMNYSDNEFTSKTLDDLVAIPQDQVHPVVMIECPRLLFPSARQIVADAVRNGGFPPLYLDPVDFAGLYMQRLAEAQGQPSAPVA